MTIGTKEAQIIFGIIFSISIDVVNFQGDNARSWMFLIPATLRTFISVAFDKISLEMFRNIPCRYTDASVYFPLLPIEHPIIMLMINLTFIRTKFDLILLERCIAVKTMFHANIMTRVH